MKKKIVSILLTIFIIFTTLSPTVIAAKNTIKDPSNILAVVNKNNVLPSWYKPNDLVLTNVATVSSTYKRYMRKEAANALKKMFDSAKKEGHTLYTLSGYRSYSRQKDIFNRYAAIHGQAAANKFSARPGESEHQTGLVMDITSKSADYDLKQSFGNTTEGKWLAKNAHKYGFIIRYPKGKESLTGYQYEPWHFRYVGVGPATTIYNNNWILEQYKKPVVVKKSVSISTNKTSGIEVGNTINISSSSKNMKNPEYKFFVNLGSSWQTIKNYSSTTNVNWKPSKIGTYKLVVHVKEKGSNKKYEKYASIYFKVSPEKKAVNLDINSSKGNTIGSKIILTGSTKGLNKPEYKFYINKGSSWELLRDYEMDTNIAWYPKSEGKYKVVVHSRENSSSKKYDVYNYKYIDIKKPQVEKVKKVDISTNSNKKANIGSTIKISAKAYSNKDVEYRFHLNKGNNWYILQNYSDLNTINWTPESIGKYKLVVHSRIKGSKDKYEAYATTYFEVEKDKVETVNFTTNKDGNDITINATSEGSRYPEYKYYLYQNNKWYVLKDYSDSTTCKFTLEDNSVYKIVVHVRTKGENIKYESYNSKIYK